MNTMQSGDYFKTSKEACEMFFQGLETSNKVAQTWLDATGLFFKWKPENIMEAWKESSPGIYKDLIEAYSRSFRFMGPPNEPTKASCEEAFKAWQSILEAVPGVVPSQKAAEEYVMLSKEWQQNYSKFYNAWLDYSQKMGEVYKSGMDKRGDGEMLKSSLESSETLTDAWMSFVAAEFRDLFRYWKSVISKGGEEAAA